MIKSVKIHEIDCYVYYADSRIDNVYAAFGPLKTIKQLAEVSGADVASNLPYAEYKITGRPLGRNVVDGKVVSQDSTKTFARDSLYMLSDGSMVIGRPPADVKWSLQGSPPLLDNGVDVVNKGIERDQLGTDIWANNAAHLRIAYGLKSANELVIVRTREEVTLKTLAGIMKALGCNDAINGDGGGSTTLYPTDSGNGRKLGAALCIKEGVKMKLIGDQNPELVIAPGHGGSDPGAQGNGIIEKALTLDAGLYLFKRLGELGVKRAITRDTDIYIAPNDLAAMVKNSGAKYCISPHINAGGGDGAEVIHSIKNDGKFAKIIAEELEKAGQNIRRVFSRRLNDVPTSNVDHYFMHRETGNVMTNIVEFFFLDSKATGVNADLNEYKAEWEDWKEAVVKAYCIYTGRKYTAPNTKPTVPDTKPKDDLTGHWAEAAMRQAIKDGILSGYPDGTFQPDAPLTRAQYATIRLREKK